MRSATGTELHDALGQDHQRLEGLLAQVSEAFDANDPAGVAATWALFDAALLVHLQTEERLLIPTLFRVNQRAARSLLEEHRHIRTRLTELGAAAALHALGPSTARAFADELRAHARHEDSLLYQWADEHVGDSERALLLRALSTAAGTSP